MLKTITILAGFAIATGTLSAQHGGAAGMHAGPVGGFRAGASAPTRSFSTAAPRFAAPNHSSFPRVSSSQPGAQRATAGNWTSAGFFPTHAGAVNARGGRDGHRRFSYGYGGYPLLGYAGLGFYGGAENGGLNLDDNDPNDPNNDPNLQGTAGRYGYAGGGDQDGASQGPEQGPEPPASPEATDYPGSPSAGTRQPYNANGALQEADRRSATATNDGLPHPKVSLVFKDGHKLQIENYAVTQTKVFVRDNGVERDIPLSALDLASTRQANDANGVDFNIPGAP